ncbi:hypothetical protein TrRE_jg2747 [Triparma retinervis]|uniref:Uncharacterized protein n=1 Tax=Triparma retinervis TaxID=2557542 RepID=A0A9W7F8R4_9STRA|nr:hypothetical protein TrRE_jg2747 [Triparma retinervis]
MVQTMTACIVLCLLSLLPATKSLDPGFFHSFHFPTIAVNSGLAGTAISVTKTIIKHPLDTMTVRIQNRDVGLEPVDLTLSERLSSYTSALSPSPFAGIIPSVASSIPSAAVFFTIKDTVKNSLLSQPPGSPHLDIVTVTILSILAATPFYWAIRTPFESIKTQLQTPALAGAGSTMAAQGITTPLDIGRNRIMAYGYGQGSGGTGTDGYWGQYKEIMRKEGGGRALWKGAAPRVAKAAVSGAAQFAVYDMVLKIFPG